MQLSILSVDFAIYGKVLRFVGVVKNVSFEYFIEYNKKNIK